MKIKWMNLLLLCSLSVSIPFLADAAAHTLAELRDPGFWQPHTLGAPKSSSVHACYVLAMLRHHPLPQLVGLLQQVASHSDPSDWVLLDHLAASFSAVARKAAASPQGASLTAKTDQLFAQAADLFSAAYLARVKHPMGLFLQGYPGIF